ncbi:uncharacterized protein LOC130622344 [Hydractinia symbiolongicarpus]|uniref:uncharacterized protein LOC130622344 n=1 Tax=Hydractinia symbiolongicarpus TaxID=13093 RepID=UPI00254DA09D|nr:uncharacterized protein LOC130622344 [Hydractinia symbiolongicarpus]
MFSLLWLGKCIFEHIFFSIRTIYNGEFEGEEQQENEYNISFTPGQAPGAEIHLFDMLKTEPLVSSGMQNLNLKVSVHGTKLSRDDSLLVCTYSCFNDQISSTGNKAFAVVQVEESYEKLRISLSNVINDVEHIQKTGKCDGDTSVQQITLFIGGDYEFLLMSLGMESANNNHSCIYCYISEAKRQDLRNNGEQRVMHGYWEKDNGCANPPIFPSVPVTSYIIDELNLFLRISDQLEDALIQSVIARDEKEKPQIKYEYVMLEKMHSIGVPMKILRNNNKVEWTSLMGSSKTTLVKKLPSYFPSFLPLEQASETTLLWQKFDQLYEKMNRSTKLTEIEIDTFEIEVVKWVEMLKNMPGCGYDPSISVTPYIHIFVKHVPDLLRRFGTLRPFSGQGVEKKKDEFKKIFQRKTNKWDACESMLKGEK